jgi:nucleotide-binding universal stress UspA family protein
LGVENGSKVSQYRGDRDIALETGGSHMYQHIVLPLDGSDISETAIPHVETLALACGTKKVIILHVVETGRYEKLMAAGRRPGDYLQRIADKLKAKGISTAIEVLTGDPSEAIVSYAENNPCDIIVMASHGRSGVTRWAVGSVADKVFRASIVPVPMVKASGPTSEA